MTETRKSPTESATLYKIGTIKKGNDGNMWIIVENKNKVKRWKLHKKIKSQTLYDMYNMPRLEITNKNIAKWISRFDKKQQDIFYDLIDMKHEIEKLGIKFFFVPVGQSRESHGYYFINESIFYILQDLYNYSKDDYLANCTMAVILPINKYDQLADNLLYIYHTEITKSLKTKITTLMKKHFGTHFTWNGDHKSSMLVTM